MIGNKLYLMCWFQSTRQVFLVLFKHQEKVVSVIKCMVDLFSGNLPYIITRCKNCLHFYDAIIEQWTSPDPPAQLSFCVLLNSDTTFVMKKQQFEISPTASARRKLENLQNSLILKTLLNFFVNIWIYISCLFEQWDFFSHLTVFSTCGTYWFRKRLKFTSCIKEGERWEFQCYVY